MTVYVIIFRNPATGGVTRLVFSSLPNTLEQVRKAAVEDANALGLTGYISHIWEMIDGGKPDVLPPPTQEDIDRWIS